MLSLFRRYAGLDKPDYRCTLIKAGDRLEVVRDDCFCCDKGDVFTVERNAFGSGPELYIHCDAGMHTLTDSEVDETNPKRIFKKL